MDEDVISASSLFAGLNKFIDDFRVDFLELGGQKMFVFRGDDQLFVSTVFDRDAVER